MKHMASKRWMIAPLILIALVVSSGCAPGGPGANSQKSDAAGATAQGEMEFGPGPFSLVDTRAGLSNLPSYKATLTVTFDGTRDGQLSQWSKTYVLLKTQDPIAYQMTLEKTGDLSDLETLFRLEMDGANYEKRGENACLVSVLEPGNSLGDTLEPAGLLNGVIGAEEAGAETVNGVDSDKYTFDERMFGQAGLAESSGEMWVASAGGYIVKYVSATEGDAAYFGEGIEGRVDWDYALADVDQTSSFVLPEDCPAGIVDAPLLPDASNVVNLPSVLTYDTGSSLADAAAFYQEQLPGLGWTLIRPPSIGETSALMELTRGDQALTVISTTEAGLTTITILLDKAQQ